VLQEREFMRVGGTEALKTDVRIIAATNKNLGQGVREGKFREDLYYRLNVIPILCPPLRERGEDITTLAYHFMRKAAFVSGRRVETVSPEAIQALKNYSWPGNIRQLEWAMERAVVLGEKECVELGDLPPEVLQRVPAVAVAPPQPVGDGLTPIISEGSWEEHEKAKILEALQRSNWSITRAAHLLGMTFRTLQYRLEKFGIRRPSA
jgi:transcriptional regulator with PAS, ATPase and Fis domain